MALTGNIGVRFGWFGKLVVQCEHEVFYWPPGSDARLEWKDASLNDLVQAMKIGAAQQDCESE